MCSICGFADFRNKNMFNKNIVSAMGKRMKHLGPDATEDYCDEFTAIPHNRLAVMDVQNGRQPMSAEYNGNKYVIIYNGEIYNTDELKSKIKNEYNISMKTECDTEIVLWTYILY